MDKSQLLPNNPARQYRYTSVPIEAARLLNFTFDADPGPPLDFDADPDPAFYSDAEQISPRVHE
jgi:hypothetical protein